MKQLLLLSLLLSSAAFAGLPEEDFVIDAIRESFKAGHAPQNAWLLPGSSWVCGIYDTQKGYQSGTVGVTLGGAAFQNTSQGLLSSTGYLKTAVPYAPKSDSLMSYDLNSGKPFDYNFIREYNDALIIELADPTSVPVLPSVINPSLTVSLYYYCIPYEQA